MIKWRDVKCPDERCAAEAGEDCIDMRRSGGLRRPRVWPHERRALIAKARESDRARDAREQA